MVNWLRMLISWQPYHNHCISSWCCIAATTRSQSTVHPHSCGVKYWMWSYPTYLTMQC